MHVWACVLEAKLNANEQLFIPTFHESRKEDTFALSYATPC